MPVSASVPWAVKTPPNQDFGRAVQLANDVVTGARGAMDASVRGDAAGAQVQAAEAAGKAALLACLLGGDAAGSSGGAGVHLADLDPLDVRALSRGNPAAVRRLYGDGFPFWCKQDGTRFRAQAQLDAHMDLLFRRKRARREQKGSAQREWYCTGEEWMTDFGRLGPPASGPTNGAADGVGGNGGDGEGDGENGVMEGEDADELEANVPADERFTKCRICGDRFDMFYDNDEEEWMYRNACYITVTGAGGGLGDDGEDEERGDEVQEGGGDGSGDEGEGGSRKIIVHRLCLEVSGLRDKAEISWKDLMPGTPRQGKRVADAAGLDSQEAGDGEESGWDQAAGSPSSAAENGGADGFAAAAAESVPPLKRAKAEVEDRKMEEGFNGEEFDNNSRAGVKEEGHADPMDDDGF